MGGGWRGKGDHFEPYINLIQRENRRVSAGGTTGRAGDAYVGDRHEREFAVHGRQQAPVGVQRAGRVLGAVAAAQVQAAQSARGPGRRAAARPVRDRPADRGGHQGSDGTAIRLGVHAVHRTGRAAYQGRVRREYTTTLARFTATAAAANPHSKPHRYAVTVR